MHCQWNTLVKAVSLTEYEISLPGVNIEQLLPVPRVLKTGPPFAFVGFPFGDQIHTVCPDATFAILIRYVIW
jgi:hypothetical protein